MVTNCPSFFKGKKILVTGGSGFIGSNVVEKLAKEKDLHIRVIFRGSYPDHLEHLSKSCSIEFIGADLTDINTCLKATRDIDFVFHSAAMVRNAPYSLAHPGTMLSLNLMINTNMLEAARRSAVERYQFVSSVSGYPAKASIPYKEESFFGGDIDHIKSSYGWSKRIGEMQAVGYHTEFGMKISVVRPFNSYGPNDNFSDDRNHVITFLIRNAIRKDNPFVVWGDGTSKRSFIYVTDVVDGMLRAMEKMNTPEAINLGSEEEIDLQTLSILILKLSDHEKANIVYDQSKPIGQSRVAASIEKAKKLLDFVPQVKLEDGLRETIGWYRYKTKGSQ